ncbi:MAG TPA: RNA 2',3'-cyclic phosphodiesterase [Candidatus Dormibacteraeota bacterium]
MAPTPEAETKPWRLFVAVELPPALRDALREPLEGLAPLKDWIRASPLEQIHLTLHFLASVDLDRIPSIVASLGLAVRGHVRFQLAVRGIGAFGGTRRPRVLWAGFGDHDVDRLRALRRDTGAALADLGFDIDPDFEPHLTLARSRRPFDAKGRQALRTWYDTWKDKEFGVLPVASVHLMRSQLGGGPARHSSLASSELQ